MRLSFPDASMRAPLFSRAASTALVRRGGRLGSFYLCPDQPFSVASFLALIPPLLKLAVTLG
jgi:hypothetical protein